MIHFIILFSRQGKIRLQKWYEARTDQDKKKITRELTQIILARKPKMCNFLEWRNLQIVYKRYASLFFAFAIDREANELITLEIIHRYVEVKRQNFSLKNFYYLNNCKDISNESYYLAFERKYLSNNST